MARLSPVVAGLSLLKEYLCSRPTFDVFLAFKIAAKQNSKNVQSWNTDETEVLLTNEAFKEKD